MRFIVLSALLMVFLPLSAQTIPSPFQYRNGIQLAYSLDTVNVLFARTRSITYKGVDLSKNASPWNRASVYQLDLGYNRRISNKTQLGVLYTNNFFQRFRKVLLNANLAHVGRIGKVVFYKEAQAEWESRFLDNSTGANNPEEMHVFILAGLRYNFPVGLYVGVLSRAGFYNQLKVPEDMDVYSNRWLDVFSYSGNVGYTFKNRAQLEFSYAKDLQYFYSSYFDSLFTVKNNASTITLRVFLGTVASPFWKNYWRF